MTNASRLTRTILSQIRSKALFEQVKSYAYDYMDTVNQRPVYPSEDSLERLSVFDEPFPSEMGDSETILKLLHEYGSPATIAQTGNRYFGFVCGGITPAAIASKWLADVWDQNAGLFVMSPIASCLETVCERWLVDLLELPLKTRAGFVTGTSAASMCGLVAARNYLLKKSGWDVQKKGLFAAPKLRVVLGEQAHSSIFKALSLIGFGQDDLEMVPNDSQGRMIPGKMPVLDNRTLVIAQAGNVNTGAFDPISDICDRAVSANAWVHIDGAFGLWAAGSQAKKHLVLGIEKADSWSVDAHKTLNAPYDCGIVLCKNEQALVSALQNTGDYIQYGQDRDGMLYTPEMSRRARSVEIWATLKFFGRKGIESLVDSLCDKACQFAEQLRENKFIVLNDVVFNQVLISCDDQRITTRVLEKIQSDGTCWCGGSVWNGKPAIRISVCSWATGSEDVKLSVQAFVKARNQALANG